MRYDYCAFRKEQLENPLSELEQASVELEQAKKQKNNKDARQKAERKIEQAAVKAVQIEPHLSYLWYEAKGSELKNPIRDAWQKHLTANSILREFQFLPKLSDIDRLPFLSFMLRVPFKLRKPYLSKDDRASYLLDNPVRKDKVFQTPIVASTSWKGALHNAMVQQLAEWWCNLDEPTKHRRSHRKQFVAKRVNLARLFGTEKGVQIDDKNFESYLDNFGGDYLACWYRRYVRRYFSSTGFFSGRLYFYPTFFNKIGLEVINPHDRKTGVGKNPILIECTPIGAIGDFVLLYVPFGEVKQSEVAEDLKLVAEGVQAMLTIYGFGAKTSSGFGIADVEGKGELAIRADLPNLKQTESEIKPIEPDLPRYLIAPGQLHPDFQSADGSLKSEAEYLKGKFGKKEKQLYDKAKKWWEREGRQLAEATTQELPPEPEPPPKSSVTEVSLVSLRELGDRVQSIAEYLQGKNDDQDTRTQ
jgi:CRISPR-associated protein Cmr2